MGRLKSLLVSEGGHRRVARLALALSLAVSLGHAARAQSTARLSGDDYSEILQLYFKYPLALDNGDAEGYADLFTEDGAFGDRVGRAALLEFVRARKPSTVRHAPLTPMITVSSEGARGVVMNLFIDVGQDGPRITRVSQYTDTLVKTSRGWRFKTRINGPADVGANSGPVSGGGRGAKP